MTKSANAGLREVRSLFNGKATTWNAKYEADGPLAFRIAAFQRLLLGKLPINSTVLDLGCGTGAISSALAADGFRVTACDFAEEMINVGKRIHGQSDVKWSLLPLNWEELPFDVGSFDAIVASSVLEYVPNLNAVLAECERVLRSGGILVATVPNLLTLTRKLEGVARPAVVLLDDLVGSRLRRLHSYATYLRCSRNRLSSVEWQAAGARAKFASVNRIDTGGANVSLEFLAFYKTTSEARQ